MPRRLVLTVLALVALLTGLAAVPVSSAGALSFPYRRWTGPKTYACEANGPSGVRVTLSDQAVEFGGGLPADAQFTINYVDDGVETASGPYTVEQTSGTKVYGAFAEPFAAYPFTFQFRIDTLINGSVVYTSELKVTCSGPSTGEVNPVNTVVSTSPYRRWTSPKSVTCTTLGTPGVSIANQNVEFNALQNTDTFTIAYVDNGSAITDGPYPVEQTSGTKAYGAFFEPFAAYPFTFDFRLGTQRAGTTIYTSTLHVRCEGDGPATTVRSIDAVVDPAPLANWGAFVTQQYDDMTASTPSTPDLNRWKAALSAGTKTKGDLIDELRRSTDNTANVDPAARLYRAFLQRIPDAGGLKFWVTRRRNGSWPLTKIAQTFATSNEFTTKYGALSNEEFVTRIYTDVLGRAADPGGVAFWTAQLDQHKRDRGSVMVGFSESNEYKTKQVENNDVAISYIFLLGRAPTKLEANGWVARQKAGTSRAELAKALLTSPAYAARIENL